MLSVASSYKKHMGLQNKSGSMLTVANLLHGNIRTIMKIEEQTFC